MKHIFIFFVFITDKTHSVQFNVFGNLQHRNEFACNEQVILQCVVDPKTDPLVWKIGNPVIPTTDVAAQCSGLTCIKNPALSSIYDFSYDENSGKSNLTISSVTLAEDGKQYDCDDGSTSLIFDAVVQVPPVKENTIFTDNTVTGVAENTIITCTTGCVTDKIAQLVTFKWYTIDGNGSVEIYNEATPPSSSDDSPCQINSDCISSDSVELSNNLTITQDDTAEEVYFRVDILLGGDLLYFVKTNSTFRPKSGQDSTTNTNPFANHTIVGTTSAAVSFSTEVGSNATTETVSFNTTANSTVYPSNDKFEMTYIFVITIIVVVVLGAVVVVIFLFVLRMKKKINKKVTNIDSNSKHTSF